MLLAAITTLAILIAVEVRREQDRRLADSGRVEAVLGRRAGK